MSNNVVEKEEKRTRRLGTKYREKGRKGRRGKVSGAALISSTPLITMTEGGHEREKVSRGNSDIWADGGGKKEGGKKKWREAKKRERAANYFAKEANEQEAKIEN